MAAEIRKVVENKEKSIFILTGDGGAETGAIKVDISTLPGAPARVKVLGVEYSIEDSAVEIYYDRTVPQRIAILSRDGQIRLGMEGGIEDTGTGGTGDILLTTRTPTPKSYTIVLFFKADAS